MSAFISPRRRIFSRRDQQAFLEQVGGVAAVGAGHLAAEIGLVRDVADVAGDAGRRTNIGEITVTSVAWFWQA